MKVGDSLRIGFLKAPHQHSQREIDHLAFTIDEDDLESLARRLQEQQIIVLDQTSDRMLIRDPFGLVLELWPRSVLAGMGLL